MERMRNILLFGLTVSFLIACTKSGDDEEEKLANLQIMLTDAPAAYDEVNVDIQEVKIQPADADEDDEWISLQVNRGIYNLLDYKNGGQILLAFSDLPPGQYSQLRIVLGTENSIMADGISAALKTPSAQQSGLKVIIDLELKGGSTSTLWLDFDAGRSIVRKGNGNYSLKPVIRTFTSDITGSISGIISPAEAKPQIRVSSITDTLSTFAEDNGYFLFRGVPDGTYAIEIYPSDDHYSMGMTRIVVQRGQATDLGTIQLLRQKDNN